MPNPANPGRIGMLTFNPHQSALQVAACRADAALPVATFGRLEGTCGRLDVKLPFTAQSTTATLGRVQSAAITVAPPVYGSFEIAPHTGAPATPGRIDTSPTSTSPSYASPSDTSPTNNPSPSRLSRSSRSPHPRSPEESSGMSVSIPQQISPPISPSQHDGNPFTAHTVLADALPPHAMPDGIQTAPAEIKYSQTTPTVASPPCGSAHTGSYALAHQDPHQVVEFVTPGQAVDYATAVEYVTPAPTMAQTGSTVTNFPFPAEPPGNNTTPGTPSKTAPDLAWMGGPPTGGIATPTAADPSSPTGQSSTPAKLAADLAWLNVPSTSTIVTPLQSPATPMASPTPRTRPPGADLLGASIGSQAEGIKDEPHQEDDQIQLELAASSEWEWLSIHAQERRHDELGLRPPKVAEFIASSDFVGLGCFCATSRALQCMGLKNFSYPFDWVRSSTSGIIHCLDTKFEDFLTWSITGNDGPKGAWFGGSQWGGSFWHHDPSSAKIRQEFTHRIERLYGLREISLSTTRVFVRAVNCTREILESFRLFEALQRALPASEIYLLILVDLQATSGLIGLSGAQRVLVYRVDAGVYADGGRDWTMRKQSEAYAEGCALAIRVWAGEIDCMAIPQMPCFEAIYKACDNFDGGNPSTSLYWPRRMMGELIEIHRPSVQEQLNKQLDSFVAQSNRQPVPQGLMPAHHSWGSVMPPPSPYPSYTSGLTAGAAQQAMRAHYRLQPSASPAVSPGPSRFCVVTGPPQQGHPPQTQGMPPPQGLSHKMSLTSLTGLQITPRTGAACGSGTSSAGTAPTGAAAADATSAYGASPQRMRSDGRQNAESAPRTRSPVTQPDGQFPPAVRRCASPLLARFGSP